MPLSGSLDVQVNDREVLRAMRQIPKVANQEMNRAYKRVVSSFAKDITPQVKAHFKLTPRSKAKKVHKKGKNRPSIPRDLQRRGYRAALFGSKRLQGKGAVIYSSSPLQVIREEGGVIRPKKGKYLFIRGKKGFTGRGKRDTANRKAQIARTGGRYRFPIVALVKRVVQPPVLGLSAAWSGYEGRAAALISGGLDRIVNRADKIIASGKSIF